MSLPPPPGSLSTIFLLSSLTSQFCSSPVVNLLSFLRSAAGIYIWEFLVRCLTARHGGGWGSSGSLPPGTTSGFSVLCLMAWHLSSQWSLKQIWWWFGSVGCGGGGGRWWWFVAGLLFCLFCVFVVGGGWFISDGDWGLVRRRGWSMVEPSKGGGGF